MNDYELSSIITLNEHTTNGTLIAIDDTFLQTKIKRIFYIYNVPENEVRGNHAHENCTQFLICICGSVLVHTRNLNNNIEQYYTLNNKSTVLKIPPLNNIIMSHFSSDCVLLVIADKTYSDDKYLKN
jgi:UDP-2-acetamido-3-amino-2,3-dideoxy-glucuronate N-acetyltransferase